MSRVSPHSCQPCRGNSFLALLAVVAVANAVAPEVLALEALVSRAGREACYCNEATPASRQSRIDPGSLVRVDRQFRDGEGRLVREFGTRWTSHGVPQEILNRQIATEITADEHASVATMTRRPLVVGRRYFAGLSGTTVTSRNASGRTHATAGQSSGRELDLAGARLDLHSAIAAR